MGLTPLVMAATITIARPAAVELNREPETTLIKPARVLVVAVPAAFPPLATLPPAMIKLVTIMTLPWSPLIISDSPLTLVQSTSAPLAKALVTSPVGVRICRPTPDVLVVKYVLPGLGTPTGFQFVEPVTDEVPAASLTLKKTFPACAGKVSRAISARMIANTPCGLTMELERDPEERDATV